jgi:hypothetical protein
MPHWLNLATHIVAGTLGIGLGLTQLVTTKGGEPHRRRGMQFAALTLVVTGTGALGNIFFRFMPLFAVLTVLVSYQVVSGVRVSRTREMGPARFDLILTIVGIGAGAAILPLVLGASETASTQPVVIWSTIGAFASVLGYDLARWTFPQGWHRRVWESEHIYKMVASLFGMISALIGNTVRWGQPWSQVLPSLVGLLLIAVFIVRRATAGPVAETPSH